MTELSPAAKAVLDAYDNSPLDEDCGDRVAIAAALRAAADNCGDGSLALTCIHSIHAIADELEGAGDD